MGSLLFLFLSFFTFQVRGEESCFLRSYVQSIQSPVREVTFPLDGSLITRVIPKATENPRLKELTEFIKSSKIVLVKGTPPVNAGENAIYIGLPQEALNSERALVENLEKALFEYADAPLNYNRLPTQSQKLVQQMKEKFKTKFINEHADHGTNYRYINKIGIKLRHPDNLRVNSVVVHEITHNTTDRRILEAFNPKLKASTTLTPSLIAREMTIKAKGGKSLNLPAAISSYDKLYRSDEIEALLREMAQARKDGLSIGNSLNEIHAFIDSQEIQLRSLLKNKGSDLRIVTEAAEPELGAGRRQRRTITTNDVDYEIGILVPRGLSGPEEVNFILNTFKQRIETLEQYRLRLNQRFQ